MIKIIIFQIKNLVFLIRWDHISVLQDTRAVFTDGDGSGMENSNALGFPVLKQSPETGRVVMVQLNMQWRSISNKYI